MLFTKPFKFFVYIQVYLMDYYVTNKKWWNLTYMCRLAQNKKSKSNDGAEVK